MFFVFLLCFLFFVRFLIDVLEVFSCLLVVFWFCSFVFVLCFFWFVGVCFWLAFVNKLFFLFCVWILMFRRCFHYDMGQN